MTPTMKAVWLLAGLGLLMTAGCAPISTAPEEEGIPPSSGPDVVISDRTRNPNPAVEPDEIESLAEGNAAFAFDLYRLLAAGEGNLFFSPYSISVALAMTYAGASGDTAAQMADSLHFALPPERLHPAFNAYALDLQARAEAVAEGTPFELSIANALWGQQGFAFLPGFLDLLAENYGAGMRLVDYTTDPEGARLAINEWVSDETREKIQDLIPSGAIDAMTRLVLANAIYFKAGWRNTFNAEVTAPAPFTLPDGSTIEVEMMSQEESFGYALLEGYRAIELPYQEGNVSMLVILPDEGRFADIEQALDPAMVEALVGNLTYGPVVLSLPKFTTEASFRLNDALQALGMGDAFDAARADFSSMDGARDLFIGSVLHKAFVAVDENGTEAAAATAVIMELMSAPILEPIEFTVDRPFIYLIRDNQTGMLLFVGRVLDPLG